MSGIVRGVGILVAGMAAGASLAWGSGLSAAHSVTLASFLDVHRDVHTARASLSMMLDAGALVVTVFTAFHLREKPRALPSVGLAALALVLANVLGFFLCEPISRSIAGWSAASAPSDAASQISLLSWLLIARAVLEGLAGFGLLVSLLRDRPVRRAYSTLQAETPETAHHTVLVPGR